MEFATLGSVRVRQNGADITMAPMSRTLLAILLVTPNRPVPVDVLVDALWNGQRSENARQRLHLHVHQLRKALGDPKRVERASDAYLVRVDDGELDAEQFESGVREGRRAIADGHPERGVHDLRVALDRWRGEPFGGAGDNAPVRSERDRLAGLRSSATESLYAAALECGRHAEVLPDVRDAVQRQPLHERLRALLMVALYRTGQQADALQAYREVRDALVEELGVEPGPELQRVHRAILAGDAVDLDETRDAAPRPARRPTQLPPDLASFTGRTDEVSAVVGLGTDALATNRGTVTVAALDGMAGVGKTALAIHAAHRLSPEFPDGQVFIDLHGFSESGSPIEPTDALDRLLRALGVPGEQIPQEPADRSALWRSTVADLRLLIMLDNAASEDQVRPLLPAAAGCLVLITSRRRLSGLDDVRLVPVDVLPQTDATAVFRRAAGVDPADDARDDLVAEVTQLCGRLPLAVRIAAARLRDRPAWGISDLTKRLRDQQERLGELTAGDRSVAAAFGLSYDQLPPPARRLFCLLGLHTVPDVGMHAAAALCDLPVESTRRLLDELVDMHLLETCAPGRYFFHDLLGGYAAQLAAEEVSETDRRLAVRRLLDCCCDRTAAAMLVCAPGEGNRHRPGPVASFEDRRDARDWLDAEHGSLIAASDLAVRYGLWVHVICLSGNLGGHLLTTARCADALALHERAMYAAQELGDQVAEGRTLCWLASVRHRLNQTTAAVSLCEQALAKLAGPDDPAARHEALCLSATLSLYTGDLASGRLRLDQARALCDESSSIPPSARARMLDLSAYYCNVSGDHAGAARFAQECLRVSEELEPPIRARARQGLGLTLRHLRRNAEAVDTLTQSLTEYEHARLHTGRSLVLTQIGANLRALGRIDEALARHTHAVSVARETGDRNAELEARLELGLTERAAKRDGAAARQLSKALKLATALEQWPDCARIHDALARMHLAGGDTERAREHWRQALALYAELGMREERHVRGSLDALGAAVEPAG